MIFLSLDYNFGIRLCKRSNDETVIMFNARNELDQSRFSDDLAESIAEMDEMESIRAHNIVNTIHSKYQDRLKRHTMMHSQSEGSSLAPFAGVSSVSTTSTSSLSSASSSMSTSAATKTLNNQGYQQRTDEQQAKAPSDASSNTCDMIRNISGKAKYEQLALNNDINTENKQSKDLTDDIIINHDLKSIAKESTKIAKQSSKVKFSSMMNLSSYDVSLGDASDVPCTGEHSSKCLQIVAERQHREKQQHHHLDRQTLVVTKSNLAQRLKPNLSCMFRCPSPNTDSNANEIGTKQKQKKSSSNGLGRRGSTSSTHSLDSGLFLSRDISPNQSN